LVKLNTKKLDCVRELEAGTSYRNAPSDVPCCCMN